MPAPVRPSRHHWTEEEFYAVRDAAPPGVRHELVDGELLVTPAPGRPHQGIAAGLFERLAPYVRANKLGQLLFAPFDVRLDRSVILQPDLLLIPNDAPYNARGSDVSFVTLAVEIISPGSARYDRVTKRMRYQHYRIPEYWVVDGESRTVERWRPDDERPEVIASALLWHPPGATDAFAVDLEAFFADLPGPPAL